jgi:3-oxoacyl-[acyl-carrier protein] reductase
MLAPALLIRAVVPGMIERRFVRTVNITSAMVKAPLSMMGLSTAARMGLTALCKAVSRDVAEHNVTINNLLPERPFQDWSGLPGSMFDTGRGPRHTPI